MSNAEIIYLPVPKELTSEQREYWGCQLEIAERSVEIAERSVEIARRMLGMLAIEKGME